MRDYFQTSKSFYYSLLLTLPLLLIYELGIHLLFRHSYFEIRNTGDLLLRNLLSSLHLDQPWILSTVFILLFSMVTYINYHRETIPALRSRFLLFMLAESLIWGLVLFVGLAFLAALPLQMNTLTGRLAQVNLAIGAGVYEELIFRAALIPSLGVVLHRGFGLGPTTAQAAALLSAAFIFAGFHLFMEPFQLSVFIQRTAGGVLLGLLYTFRGYGIAVYSHIVFNLTSLFQSF